jgi:hypothetical protein
MTLSVAKSIERFFFEHEGDGEFACEEAFSISVIKPPQNANQRIVLGSKNSALWAISNEAEALDEFGAIACCGLPLGDQLASIQAVVTDREVLFLGDLDPVDLLAFAWFRENLKPQRLTYAGISDRFLDTLQLSCMQVPSIRLSPSEEAAVAQMDQFLPDCRSLVGPRCKELLTGGRKIEIEAIISYTDRALPVYREFDRQAI